MNAMQKLLAAAEDVELENACLQFMAAPSVRNAGVVLLLLGTLQQNDAIDAEDYNEWFCSVRQFMSSSDLML